MQFDSWAAFWDMGGYGFFVWLAFGVSLGAMILLVMESLMARKRLAKQVAADLERKNRIAAANKGRSQAENSPVAERVGE